jgi:U3 small nucleolar RNA-associated protein 19
MPKSKVSIRNFYISEFSRPPDGATQSSANETPDEQDEEDDWRAFFDAKPDEEVAGNTPAGGRPSELSTHRALHSLQSHRAQFSAAWLAVLQHVKKSPEQSSRVLSILHRSILPHLIQPIQLMDWISACVDFGEIESFYISYFLNSFRWSYRATGLQCTIRSNTGAQPVGVISLSLSPFVNLSSSSDYPDFYTRLYAVLDRNILHVKYRARFFRLLELFLSSTLVSRTIHF